MKIEIDNHSLPIYPLKILLALEEAASKFCNDEGNHGIHMIVKSNPKRLIFVSIVLT